MLHCRHSAVHLEQELGGSESGAVWLACCTAGGAVWPACCTAGGV